MNLRPSLQLQLQMNLLRHHIPVKPPSFTKAEQALFDAMAKRDAAKKKRDAAKKNLKVRKKPSCARAASTRSASSAATELAPGKKPPRPTCHGSTNWKKGRIYTLWLKRRFRIIKNVKKPSKEASVTCMYSEWKVALSRIPA